MADTLGSSINARPFPPQGTKAESYKAYLGDISLTAPGNWGWFSGSTLFGAVVTGYNPHLPHRRTGGSDQLLCWQPNNDADQGAYLRPRL